MVGVWRYSCSMSISHNHYVRLRGESISHDLTTGLGLRWEETQQCTRQDLWDSLVLDLSCAWGKIERKCHVSRTGIGRNPLWYCGLHHLGSFKKVPSHSSESPIYRCCFALLKKGDVLGTKERDRNSRIELSSRLIVPHLLSG